MHCHLDNKCKNIKSKVTIYLALPVLRISAKLAISAHVHMSIILNPTIGSFFTDIKCVGVRQLCSTLKVHSPWYLDLCLIKSSKEFTPQSFPPFLRKSALPSTFLHRLFHDICIFPFWLRKVTIYWIIFKKFQVSKRG